MKFAAIIGALSLLFVIVSCSQVESIDNEITKEHVEVGSTGIYIFQPYQFDVSTDFNGFIHPHFESSVHVDNFKFSYSESVEKYESSLKELKIDDFETTDYIINGLEAKYIFYISQSENKKYTYRVLILGNDKKSTRIQAIGSTWYDAKIGDEVEKSIFSIAFKDY